MTVLPKSKLGKWSFGLIFVFILGLLIFFGMVNIFGQQGGDYLYSNLALFLPMLFAVLGAAASFITGMISFFASKERALLVFIAVIIGLCITAYTVMLLTFPE